MNERWKYSDFKLSEAVLVIISVDGCFQRLDEFYKFVEKITDKEPFATKRDINNYKARNDSELPTKFHDSLQWKVLYEITADDLEAKSHEAQRIHLALVKEFSTLSPNLRSFKDQLSIEYEISLIELHQWLNKNGITDIAEQFKPIDSPCQPKINDSKSRLSESPFWNKFEAAAKKAIDEYPAWKSKNQRANIGHTLSWLKNTRIAKDDREADIIKKVLSDIFEF